MSEDKIRERAATNEARGDAGTDNALKSSAEDVSGKKDTAMKTTIQINNSTAAQRETRTRPDSKPVSLRNYWLLQSRWSFSLRIGTATLAALALAVLIAQSFLTRQLDVKGCAMSYMRPQYIKFDDFDTEHTRLAGRYSLYLYREAVIDDDTRLKGVPVLFIPGNAGSYRQVRSLGAESAVYYQDVLAQELGAAVAQTKRPLDFFSVDFNEDITAFHGQTLLDQAEYLNDAIAFILKQYHNPNKSLRDSHLPDPSSVILVGHSMGGVVARTMLTLPNYQSDSINTIVTLAAPHARAPVSFDADMVHIYDRVNTYWRNAFTGPPSNNSLSETALISIAGGSLDTIVPSDYSTVASIVPFTHGFTVFTSSIPNVWTSMDHLAITWCDQLRKRVVRALYRVTEPSVAHQTRSLSERMQVFRKLLLTGMEDVAEHVLGQLESKVLLSLADASQAMVPKGQRLDIRSFGSVARMDARLLPIPPHDATDPARLTLMTDQMLSDDINQGLVKVLLCSTISSQPAQQQYSEHWDLSEGKEDATRLACRHAAQDTIQLPASRRESKNAFEPAQPFSYLQYNVEELANYQFVAVIDRLSQPMAGFLFADFVSIKESSVLNTASPESLLFSRLNVTMQPAASLATELKLSALQSSLLAYRLRIDRGACDSQQESFAPLVRQSIEEPYESKFYVNARDVEISLHGVAPYLPPALNGNSVNRGLSLQVWLDPSCAGATTISLQVDILGSLGKLWMRYRTIFATFPLAIVALVLRNQFKQYYETCDFISFTLSMHQCLRHSIPVFLFGLSLLSLLLGKISQLDESELSAKLGSSGSLAVAAVRAVDCVNNNLLLGSADVFVWFLVPMFGMVSVGICILVNYIVLAITQVGALACSLPPPGPPRPFNIASSLLRIAPWIVLAWLVFRFIPYQFFYLVLCLVQLTTSAKLLRRAKEKFNAHDSFCYNYSHSILLLMLWILPINLPVLVVWIRNLGVNWMTPFPSHHNMASIVPFQCLLDVISLPGMPVFMPGLAGQMTTSLLLVMAVCAGVYGVTHAYLLHYAASFFCLWLFVAHMCNIFNSWRLFKEEEATSGSLAVEDPTLGKNSTASKDSTVGEDSTTAK